ncbi:hypothetical protein [Streptomyces sp. NPDC050804]|uniref:hypothetical protein n=1 Tax=unclassified Streptomyces TaxID=2593676 RepID=UPI00344856F2|nr:hypothetical protein OG214_23045 [Streptomyces sp. NBC_00872]
MTGPVGRPPLGAIPRPDVVPYIACWSSEHRPPGVVVVRGGGIAYADEGLYERDDMGVLWKRIGISPGKGRPEFGKVHFLRQRRAMRKRLCQVCGGPSDRTSEGTLWLVGEDPDGPELWEPGYVTTHPPVCVPCAVMSVGACPHLREVYVALRVRTFVPAGVHGALYRPDGPFPVVYDADGVAFESARIGWVLASQLIMEFQEFTVVDLEAEHAAYLKRAEARAAPS